MGLGFFLAQRCVVMPFEQDTSSIEQRKFYVFWSFTTTGKDLLLKSITMQAVQFSLCRMCNSVFCVDIRKDFAFVLVID